MNMIMMIMIIMNNPDENTESLKDLISVVFRDINIYF